MKSQHRGGTIVGFIVGLIVGLGAALAVAVYVTKVPVPFMNKGAVRNGDNDEAEARKNRDWNVNAPGLQDACQGDRAARFGCGLRCRGAAPDARQAAASAAKPAASKAEGKPGADPLGDLASARARLPPGRCIPDYYVQAGAFRSQQDADAQRAKLAMLGWEARVSEREQNGRSVPRARRAVCQARRCRAAQGQTGGRGVESALVRVQR
jgi:cell division protein FtsN